LNLNELAAFITKPIFSTLPSVTMCAPAWQRLWARVARRPEPSSWVIINQPRVLYALADVVTDLHQIAVATGHAALAATAIHNRLPRNPR
jgi:hypothetical protein